MANIDKKELESIAKEFCKQNDLTYIYANEYEIGYETKDGSLTHKSWYELYEILERQKEV